MLSRADNELVCRVGPGTPMGDLMRQYWLPILYDWELTPDGTPLRVRILGEDLIAWRDTAGRPSFVAGNCPHRGASLFFGRNEEAGLRCVYHGWKFDADGQCTDMPNEPAESDFKSKVRAMAYRAGEYGGMVWVYMGPRQADPPAIPRFEWGLVPAAQRQHSHKLIYECNWLQALEGELDTTHVYFLHSRLDPSLPAKYGAWVGDRAARLHVLNTPAGVLYGGKRLEEDGNTYWRTTQFLFPMYGMYPGGRDDGTVPLSIYVPIDDEHTLHMGVFWHPTKELEIGRDPRTGTLPDEPGVLANGVGPMKPHQTGRFFADWWPVVNHETDFHLDLDARRTKSYTGIPGIRLQDSAVIWSMGSIMNRPGEHLGTADMAIIRVRRRLLEAVKALRDHGTTPPGVDDAALYTVRSCLTVLPPEADWLTALDAWHHAQTLQHPNPGFMGRRRILEQAVSHEYAADERARGT
jgi:nitrite reductase/ring-hydroxylating ferredoxin subunit